MTEYKRGTSTLPQAGIPTQNPYPRIKSIWQSAKRLFQYIIKPYKLRFIGVVVCILISAIATVASSLFLKTLIDDYITPLLASSIPDYSGLLTALLVMAAIFAVGIIAALCYNRWMVTIAQGVLRKVRDEMFSKMQSLQ